jgi:hypothetical protein
MTIYAPDFLITLLGTKVKMRSSSRITACHPDEKLCIKGSVQMDQERNRTKSKPMTLDGQVTVPCTWISRETCLRVIENGCLRQLPEAITASAAHQQDPCVPCSNNVRESRAKGDDELE